jgi:hypothetical protein
LCPAAAALPNLSRRPTTRQDADAARRANAILNLDLQNHVATPEFV